MTDLSRAISTALLHFVWQGPLIASLLWIALAICGRRPARLRYVVSCVALAVMAVLPLVTACVVYRESTATAAALPGQAPFPMDAAGLPELSTPSFLPHWLAVLEAWTLPIWSAGVLIFAIRPIRSSRYVAQIRRSGESGGDGYLETVSNLRQRMGILRPLRVLTSRLIDVPSTVGWLKPVILLPPAALLNLSPTQLEAVLAHELAHILRHDYLVNLIQTVVETLLFYQPAVWWVSSRIRDERELCCDDMVVEICGDPVGYARALTRIERSRMIAPEFAMTSTGGTLKYRIQRLTGVGGPPSASRVSAALAVGFAIVCLLLNVRWAGAQPQSGTEGTVSRDSIWVDTVKYGDFLIAVPALGKMTTATAAELNVSSQVSDDVQLGQSATLDLRVGITLAGKVTRIGERTMNGTLPVTIQVQASADGFVGQEVDGTVQIRTLKDVSFVGRPVGPVLPESTLFRVDSDGQHLSRVGVRLGAYSVNKVQILEGLHAGDKVVLSDMSKYDGINRLRLE